MPPIGDLWQRLALVCRTTAARQATNPEMRIAALGRTYHPSNAFFKVKGGRRHGKNAQIDP